MFCTERKETRVDSLELSCHVLERSNVVYRPWTAYDDFELLTRR